MVPVPVFAYSQFPSKTVQEGSEEKRAEKHTVGENQKNQTRKTTSIRQPGLEQGKCASKKTPTPAELGLKDFLKGFGRFPAKDLGDEAWVCWGNVRNTAIVEVRKKLGAEVLAKGKSNERLTRDTNF